MEKHLRDSSRDTLAKIGRSIQSNILVVNDIRLNRGLQDDSSAGLLLHL